MAIDPEKQEYKKKIDFKYNASIYWSFLKKHKLIVTLLLIFVLIHESKQIIDRYLFKVLIDKGTEFGSGLISSDAFIHVLIIIALVFSTATIFSVFLNWIKIHLINRLETNMIFDLKKKFFNHILGLSHNFHTTHKTGSLISRLLRAGGSVERLTDVIVFNFLTLIFQLAVAVASLIYFDWLSAIIIVAVAIVFISYSVFIQKLQQIPNLEANRLEDIEKAAVSDIFTNIDSIKYFGKEKFIKNRFEKKNTATKLGHLRHWDYFKWMSAGQSLILGIGTFLLVYFSIIKFLNGEITLGTVAFIYTVYMGLVGHMFGFVHGVRGFYRSMADFQDLFQYGKIENEIKDKVRAKDLEIKKGKIEFKDVTFGYSRGRKIIDNVNLDILPGKKVALVGHSGSGKTTLIKLLYRLHDLKNGQIIVDGQNIKDLKQESLRNALSVVPQEAVLFDDTIYNNILFSRPDAKKEEVLKAMKFAHLDDFVAKLPKKEKTIVGERGVRLSGGEKQRVSIARAILADKKILVLDEATSALDSKTENEIQRDLQKLMKGRTSIIIAHRLSTIMNADKIVVMDKGKIVQVGKHNTLINKKGPYRELWNLQKGGYIEE